MRDHLDVGDLTVVISSILCRLGHGDGLVGVDATRMI